MRGLRKSESISVFVLEILWFSDEQSCSLNLDDSSTCKSFGRGGGASGRAATFCPSRLGSKSGLDLCFFGSVWFG